jgi:hypothetical protein
LVQKKEEGRKPFFLFCFANSEITSFTSVIADMDPFTSAAAIVFAYSYTSGPVARTTFVESVALTSENPPEILLSCTQLAHKFLVPFWGDAGPAPVRIKTRAGCVLVLVLTSGHCRNLGAVTRCRHASSLMFEQVDKLPSPIGIRMVP